MLLTFFLAFVFVALAAGVLAALSDLRGMVIPNVLSVIIISAFFLVYVVLWFGGRDDVFAPFLSHVVAALIVFCLTLLMFFFKGLGAGDSKFGTAFALWVGLKGLVPFLFYMALVGGALGVLALVLRKWKLIPNAKEGSWVARVQAGENSVPYGVAIFSGALASFVKLGYLGPEVLSSFLLQ
ncbi:MAG: prepilin peptidase [Alphaproteobacteria bacterium]|nr:prepilin peptidase [Alphaproteobacteria bacterium]